MFALDRGITLTASRRRRAGRPGSVRGGLYLRFIASAVALITINITSLSNANAYPLTAKQIDWALVAMNHLANLEESQCWVELIWKESSFNPKAINGSHYGLAQMRNSKVKDLSAREQVRWHMRYLDHRYQGSACKALKHLQTRGWH
jgi:hypothetical protein